VPEGYTSSEFASKLLSEAGIVVTPGNGFGEPGEGFFRIALTVDKVRLKEAIERIASLRL
jgi:LL-diaminopimelate aminotransferase